MGKNNFVKGFVSGLFVAMVVFAGTKAVSNYIINMPNGGLFNHTVVSSKLNLLKTYVDTFYIDDVEEEALDESAYAGYIKGVGDIYSCYYSKEEYDAMLQQQSGEYCGIGVAIANDTESGICTIVKVYDKSPAKEAGIKDDDVIVKVAGKEVAGDIDLVVSKIKGDEGTTVDITIYRPSTKKYIDMEVTRKIIESPTIDYKMIDNDKKIGYIQIMKFDANTDEIFAEAIKDLQKQGMKSVVFDLRDNPGGLYDSVCNMLDDLLPEGTIVYTLDKNGKKEEQKSDANHLDIPMTVLINGDSASAAEIFAGAIQDFKAGTIVGTQSFGKGIVQGVFPLNDGTAVKLTISKYYTPNGVNIHGKGITPDVKIEEADGEKDVQLEKALEILEK